MICDTASNLQYTDVHPNDESASTATNALLVLLMDLGGRRYTIYWSRNLSVEPSLSKRQMPGADWLYQLFSWGWVRTIDRNEITLIILNLWEGSRTYYVKR